MKMRSAIATVLVAGCCFASNAFADPPNDCGPLNSNENTTFCGNYTPPNGGLLVCGCTVGGTSPVESCLDSSYNPEPAGDQQPFNGLCSTNTGIPCSYTRPCNGYSVCSGGQCHLLQGCPANVCQEEPDGAGGYQACATATGCVAETLSVSSTDVHVGDWVTWTLVHGHPNRPFTLYLTRPDGVQYTSSGFKADPEGNWSLYTQIQSMTFNMPGNWRIQAYFPPVIGNPWTWSNAVGLLVGE